MFTERSTKNVLAAIVGCASRYSVTIGSTNNCPKRAGAVTDRVPEGLA
jgi:hypothetical protein